MGGPRGAFGVSGVLPPRPYQLQAIKAVEQAHASGMRRPAVVLPTGSGKTVVIGHLAQRRHERPWGGAGKRTLIVAHRKELIEHAAEKVADIAPGLGVGIVKAGRNETRAPVVVASIQTLQSELRRRMIADVGLIVIDECHHAAADSYLAMLEHYGAWGDGEPVGQSCRAMVLGLTATMSRGDKKSLGDVWDSVVYRRTIAEMVRAGFLVRPRGFRVRVDDLDLANVRKSRGDYVSGDLGRAVEESMAPEAIAKAIMEHCPTDPGIVFTPTVASARAVAEAMAGVGLSVRVVWGAMPDDDRDQALADYKAGRLDWLVNAQLLTEGTDLPRAKVCVIARPTRSSTMLIQMAGRVLRPYRDPATGERKTEALILFVDGRTTGYSLDAGVELFGEEGIGKRPGHEDEEPELDEDALLLGDLVERESRADEVVGGLNGALISEEIDLFDSSASAWLQTHAGIWFLPAGERLIALLPAADGSWNVAAMHAVREGTGRWVATGVHELSYAMAWAEADVMPQEKITAAREQTWRNMKPNPAVTDYARRMGVAIPKGATKGEIMQLTTIAAASRRIDPKIAMVRV